MQNSPHIQVTQYEIKGYTRNHIHGNASRVLKKIQYIMDNLITYIM